MCDVFQFSRFYLRSGQVHNRHTEVAAGQIGDAGHRDAASVQPDPAAMAQDPLRLRSFNVTVRGLWLSAHCPQQQGTDQKLRGSLHGCSHNYITADPDKISQQMLGAGWVLLCFFLAAAAAAEPAAIGPSYFHSAVYPVLEKAGCRGCHNSDGVAAGTRLRFPEEAAGAPRIDAFGKSLAALVDPDRPDRSLLLNKPTMRVPHTGGKRIDPDSDGDRALRRWVDYLAKLTPAERNAALRDNDPVYERPASSMVIRRLTHSQYNRTVRDLLGDESNPADQFPPEDFVNGFKGQYESQSTGALLADAYSAAAEKLARSAFRSGDTRGLVPCKPKSPSDEGCRAAFLRSFGLRAFRRPLLPQELQRYAALFTSVAAGERNFYRGAQAVIEAMLQSPNFLYRVEGTADAKLRGYESADRLSYFLWDSTPDDSVLRDAAAGELNTPDGFERVARRMIADPKARRSVDQFAAEWLRFDRVVNTVKDRRLFPQFTPEVAVSMTEETRRLIADAVWNDGNFMRVFDAGYAFLNGELASLYSLPAPAGEFDRVTFPPTSDRAGLVGEGTFLALTSKPSDTSPTARGLFVREQFLCQRVPDPPPGVNTNLPPVTEAKPMTNRERLAIHLSNASCATCHNLIDSIGFGLEKYDAVGRRQDKLKLSIVPTGHGSEKEKPKTFELPLDTSGHIAGLPNSEFDSPRKLGRVLAESPQCRQCVVKQLFRYQAGRLETPADRPILQKALEDFEASQFRFKELMISLAKWREFPPGAVYERTE